MVDVGRPAPRSAVQLLTSRSFGLIFFGTLITTAAAFTHGTAAAILLYDRTGSSAAVAAVTVAQFAPQLVLATISGVWADRYDPTKQMVIGRACCVLGAGITLVWFSMRWEIATASESTIAISLAAAVVGFGFVVGGPAIQATVPTLVRADELTLAMALNTAPMTLARVIGPTVGAFAVVEGGPTVAFTISAVGQAIFIPMAFLAKLPRRRTEMRAVTNGEPSSPTREVFRFLRRTPTVMAGLIGVLAVGIGSEPVLTLAPALAESLGHGGTAVGLITTCFGLGAALTLLVISTLGSHLPAAYLARWGLGLLFAGLLGCAVMPLLWLCLLSAAAMGAGFSTALTGLSTMVQGGTPDALRGRVMAMWILGFIGSRPFSVTLAGTVSDLANARAAFGSVALTVGALALATARRQRAG